MSSFASPLAPSTRGSGYFEVWALGTDNWVYQTFGDKACATSPGSSNVPVAWRRIAAPVDGAGHSLAPKMITSVLLPNAAFTTLYMIDQSDIVYTYNFSNHVWVAAPHSAIMMFSDDGPLDLEIALQSNGGGTLVVDGDNLPGISFQLRGTNLSTVFSSQFFALGQTQPVTHSSPGHAWLAGEGAGTTSQNIYRSFKQANGTWSSWQIYPTGVYPEAVNTTTGATDPTLLPWSVVDAGQYRPPGLNPQPGGPAPNVGNLFVIGGPFRLDEYIP